MNKILVGVIFGALLGAIDGATAWFEPAVRPDILFIVMASTVKGVIAGIAAGWFARKVHSIPKGIAFGFIVGLVLAFLVAMSPNPKTGEHYWWQIMLPGSVLGGVIGWATQRYGRSAARGTVAAALAFALALTGVNATAGEGHDHAKPAPNAAFERLKSLAGTWNGRTMKVDGDPTTVEYRVTAGGSVVMETMFFGEPHEMINMYTVDGDAVLAQHYCAAGNQPVLRLNAAKSSANQLVFDFVKVTGKDAPYINGVTMRFSDDGKVEEVWTSSSPDHGEMRLFLNFRK